MSVRLDPIHVFQHHYGIDRRQARRKRRRLARSLNFSPGKRTND
jgi:hypothetical protein